MVKKLLLFLLIIIHLFSKTTPSCSPKQNFCLTCHPNLDLCIECENSVLIPDENGGCKGAETCKIAENYCIECDTQSHLCENCETGFYPDKNGGCSYTNNCEISINGECIKCIDDFFLIGDKLKICKYNLSDDIKNCAKVDSLTGLCLYCETGYYFGNYDKKCTKTQNCLESIYEECKTCRWGYYLDKRDNKCYKSEGILLNCKEISDEKKCTKCDDNFYLSKDGFCVKTNNCIKTINLLCDECEKGYYISNYNNICTNTENCGYGDGIIGICNSCAKGFYLDENRKCITNTENNEFKYCIKESSGKCSECEIGYALDNDFKCVFTKNCSKSENGTCIECIENSHLGLDNRCTDIEFCIYSDFYNNCKECEENYFFNKDSELCEEIVNDTLLNCKMSDYSGTKCQECKNNYYLSDIDDLCYDNTQNETFYKCAEVNYDDICQRCEKGYFLGYIDHKCSKIEGCISSLNENVCLECNSEYFCFDVKKGICEYNLKPKNEESKFYFLCNKTNLEGNECEECIDNFTLTENGICINKDDCEKYENDICVKCVDKDEYGYDNFCLNKDFGCVKTSNENCVKCDNYFNFDECTECKEGYLLNHEKKCVENLFQ